MSSPFSHSTSKPGYGNIVISLLPPSTARLQTCSYQYPLKLIAPTPLSHVLPSSTSSSEAIESSSEAIESSSEAIESSLEAIETLIHTIYLLTYGGGLVAGDAINLTIQLAPTTRLILLTQGSTKIFKSPGPSTVSKQSLVVDLAPASALCYLPDPVQPFEGSCFVQEQIYNLIQSEDGGKTASLCVLDWVSQGRAARGENWRIWKYGSRNDVFLTPGPTQDKPAKKMRLLLRDNVILEDPTSVDIAAPLSFASRVGKSGVFGTLILYGPLLSGLANYFMDEFKALPRIGAKKWHTEDSESDSEGEKQTSEVEAARKATQVRRSKRQKQEVKDDLLWTASIIRGFVLVKFGAREVEGVKRWLYGMLKDEGSVEKEFGERALMCLK
ncbi:DNA repair protein rad5 [Venturia nashicola]|uniref:DNA repair protein rad5 n=1 Tax=Venturia nashicola TaxID=86259 RepID=A0A4Z1NVL8_9PEZI|nr:DNA repair protein rad5 [Venturia nashicola]TLD29374.1 DNA repair protein rad5 [Venturia nashicola]